jgi:NUDIX domain
MVDLDDEQPVRLPNDLPIFERRAVRLVVLDAQDKVLLFHTHDPDHPDLGRWWELPGGGIDAGETYLTLRSGSFMRRQGSSPIPPRSERRPGAGGHHFDTGNVDTCKTR